MQSLEDRLKHEAHALGFELAGIAAATPADTFPQFEAWLDADHAGDMEYLQRHAEARRHPSSIVPNVKSVVMVGMNYKTECPMEEPTFSRSPQASVGRVASYAQGKDYHDVLRRKLNELLAWVQGASPGCSGRGVVDTAPLLERDFARRAGLGWFGKNTMLLNKRLGSYFFLGALLIDLELQPDTPHLASHCGTCRACLDACPTAAFVASGVLDSRRCLSYLTIELKGAVPDELRPEMKEWLFGCDVCQEVCPWNGKAPAGHEPSLKLRDDLVAVDLIELLGFTEVEIRQRFGGTALMRTKRRGLLRNAALILGNRGDAAALPALRRAVADHDPIIRDAARWAIERIECHSC